MLGSKTLRLGIETPTLVLESSTFKTKSPVPGLGFVEVESRPSVPMPRSIEARLEALVPVPDAPTLEPRSIKAMLGSTMLEI